MVTLKECLVDFFWGGVIFSLGAYLVVYPTTNKIVEYICSPQQQTVIPFITIILLFVSSLLLIMFGFITIISSYLSFRTWLSEAVDIFIDILLGG
jgi:hypothetical protein